MTRLRTIILGHLMATWWAIQRWWYMRKAQSLHDDVVRERAKVGFIGPLDPKTLAMIDEWLEVDRRSRK